MFQIPHFRSPECSLTKTHQVHAFCFFFHTVQLCDHDKPSLLFTLIGTLWGAHDATRRGAKQWQWKTLGFSWWISSCIHAAWQQSPLLATSSNFFNAFANFHCYIIRHSQPVLPARFSVATILINVIYLLMHHSEYTNSGEGSGCENLLI
jgi:hypothetical protein